MQKLKEKFNRLFSSLKKRKLTKGFSLIELLVVVGIMGLLAAIAIPAYNNYRDDAQSGVIDSTIANVQKAFPACLTLNDFADCSNDTINGTISSTGMTRIYSNITGTMACFSVELGGTLGTGMAPGTPEYSRCTGFTNDGRGIETGSSQGFPTGTNCMSITPNVLCSAGATPAIIPANSSATICGMFGCTVGAMAGSCGAGPTTAITMANNVGGCGGTSSTSPVVAKCNTTGLCSN